MYLTDFIFYSVTQNRRIYKPSGEIFAVGGVFLRSAFILA